MMSVIAEFFESKFAKELQQGKLPEVKVQATISAESIVNIAIAALLVITLSVIVIRFSK
jgi:hypothetical protein